MLSMSMIAISGFIENNTHGTTTQHIIFKKLHSCSLFFLDDSGAVIKFQPDCSHTHVPQLENMS